MSPQSVFADIEENFRFLVAEVNRQIDDVFHLLEQPGSESIDRIEERDNYIDILKSIIENKCFNRIRMSQDAPKKTVDVIKAVNSITTNLERIGDFAVNSARQTRHLLDKGYLNRFNLRTFHKELSNGLRLVDSALFELDTSEALKICRRESRLDELYTAVLRRIIEDLRNSGPVENLVTSLFIFRYLERMGDSLLNIGEAIISAVMGERLKINQYQAIEKTLSQAHNDEDRHAELSYRTVAETRSGSRIGLIHEEHADERHREVIFKNGPRKKIREEKEAIERWEVIMPGLPPRVYGYHVHDQDASLLLECLEGRTFQQMLIDPERERLGAALEQLTATLSDVWPRTRINRRVQVRSMKQLLMRLDEVYSIHPDFDRHETRIGELEISSLEDLISHALTIEDAIAAPFSIFVHGDFNNDNIIYSASQGRIHFIDLHRSGRNDYVQDVSVFLVSNFRLRVADENVRLRISRLNAAFHDFAAAFAREQGDETFSLRLAFGLARSFITSTRFEFNEKFARNMFHRGVYLLERIVLQPADEWANFVIPRQIYTY